MPVAAAAVGGGVQVPACLGPHGSRLSGALGRVSSSSIDPPKAASISPAAMVWSGPAGQEEGFAAPGSCNASGTMNNDSRNN